jgi:hypothetical protein
MNSKFLVGFSLLACGLLTSGCDRQVPAPGGLSPIRDAGPPVSAAPATQPVVVADPVVVTPEVKDAGPLAPSAAPSAAVSQPVVAPAVTPSVPASK